MNNLNIMDWLALARASRRQDDADRSAAAHLARDLEPAAVGLHEVLHDGEAEARAAGVAAAPLVHAVEALAEARQVRLGHADARVGHDDGLRAVRPRLGRYGHR